MTYNHLKHPLIAITPMCFVGRFAPGKVQSKVKRLHFQQYAYTQPSGRWLTAISFLFMWRSLKDCCNKSVMILP